MRGCLYWRVEKAVWVIIADNRRDTLSPLPPPFCKVNLTLPSPNTPAVECITSALLSLNSSQRTEKHRHRRVTRWQNIYYTTRSGNQTPITAAGFTRARPASKYPPPRSFASLNASQSHG